MSSTTNRKVLFLCTGNICRSPTAELLAQRVAGPEVSFASAGFFRDDVECPEVLVSILDRYGLDASTHRSKVATVSYLSEFDLILAAEASHVRQAIAVLPSVSEYTFMIRELAWRFEHRTAEPAIDGIDRVALLTDVGSSPPSVLDTSGSWDIPDPYGGPTKDYEKMVSSMNNYMQTLFD